MTRVVELLSGGQSGADRGAMDAARDLGVAVGGWCPAGGWAEDLPEPPGVLALYPQLKQTPSSDTTQRTEWVIRDASCAIALCAPMHGTSPGTDLGFLFYEKHGTPHFQIDLGDPSSYPEQVEHAIEWLQSLDGDALSLAFGGPRESEYPGVYGIAYAVAEKILATLA